MEKEDEIMKRYQDSSWHVGKAEEQPKSIQQRVEELQGLPL